MKVGIDTWERFLEIWEQSVPAAQLGLMYFLTSSYVWCKNERAAPSLYQLSKFCLRVANDSFTGYDEMTKQGDWATREVFTRLLKKSVITMIDGFIKEGYWMSNHQEQIELLKVLNNPQLRLDGVKLIDAEHFHRKVGVFLDNFYKSRGTSANDSIPDEWYRAIIYTNHPELVVASRYKIDSDKFIDILIEYFEGVKKVKGWSLTDCLQMGSQDETGPFARILLMFAKQENEFNHIVTMF